MTTDARQVLVHRFKMLREQRGWSTYELARFSKLAQKTIWNMETGEVGFSVDTAERLARTFKYELWQLLIPLDLKLSSSEFKTLTEELWDLINHYSQTGTEGRAFVRQIAEREAQRSKTDNSQ